jgi:hypothetical protein
MAVKLLISLMSGMARDLLPKGWGASCSMVRICLMSVQSVSSAPAAAESGAARKRGAGADSGRASEPFALPQEAEAAAPDDSKSAAAADAKSAAAKSADAKSADAKSAETKADAVVKAAHRL